MVDTVNKEDKETLGDIISRHLPGIMQDRNKMGKLESEVDAYINLSYVRNAENKKQFTDQLTNAKMALESLYIRICQQL